LFSGTEISILGPKTVSVIRNLFIVYACFLSAAVAQMPDSPSVAMVDGSVINKLTGAPVKSAHVIYTRIAPGAGAPSSPISRDTDAEGHFSIPLAPGSYRLWVERSGFARQIYGALSPSGEGTTLTLAPGQQLRQITFRVVPLGAIAGRVSDEDGEAVTGAGIQVLRFSYASGRRQLTSVAGASSNDRGEYRVFGLPAGRYLLRASVPGAPLSRPLETGALVPEAQDPYAAVYYPGVIEVDSASPVSLAEGSELADVDFRLRKVRAVTVRGHMASPAEKFSTSQVQVVLAHNEGNVASYIDRASAFIDPTTGKFEVRGVSPGSYLLVASQLSSGRPLGGRVPVEVSATAAPEDVTVALAPAFDITGSVEVEGVARGSVPGLTVRLLPAEGLALGPQPASKVASDGSIRLAGVTPGLWTLIIDSLPEGLWIKTESFASSEVVAGDFNVGESARGQLRIVLANNGAQIFGTVTVDAQPCRATIVLAPAAPELRGSHQLYRITNSTEHGAFTLKGVRPGSYKVFAFQEIEPFDWFDPEQLKIVEAMGEPITVVAGENALKDLVAIPPEALLPQH
jgi:Carboxypeptidase regulatory-like domain